MTDLTSEHRIVIDYTIEPLKNRISRIAKRVPILLKLYISNMLPILQWIHRYNMNWFVQDIVAGITVGIVMVPQGMAYAKIANLEPQYGLYTSFVSVTVYCLFGTSKDISMGPISTVSLLVGLAINSVISTDPTVLPAEVAVTLSIFTGIVMIFISLFKLGVLVDFISEPAITGYMTGSAITILVNQCPKLLGISNVPTHESPFLVIANTLTNLQYIQLDAAFGLSSLLLLFVIRYVCGRLKFTSKKAQSFVFLFSIMRNGLVVIFGTLIAFLIYQNKGEIPISIIRFVPSGFDAMGLPTLRLDILNYTSNILPSIVLIMVLEHISVAKSFGKIYNYQIDSDQEILAIGVSNIIGSLFGGYPSTGAFSRTAIMARSGAKTPLASVFSGIVVILALYILTPAFYYIPDAILSAVVIHAVSDLASNVQYLKDLWSINFTEFFVWASAVVFAFFVDVEAGIYAAVGLSLFLMLLNLARAPVKVIGRIPASLVPDSGNTVTAEESESTYIYVDENDANFKAYVDHLPLGVLAFRLCGSILYPNAQHISDTLMNNILKRTQPCRISDFHDSNKPWNHRNTNMDNHARNLPVLKAVVLDLCAVYNIDATARQALLSMRAAIDEYSGRPIEWHFSGLQNSSVRASLLDAGFGYLDQCDSSSLISLISADDHIIPTYTCQDYVDEITGDSIHDVEADTLINRGSNVPDFTHKHCKHTRFQVPTDRYPCFHWDIDTAIRSISRRLLKHSVDLPIGEVSKNE